MREEYLKPYLAGAITGCTDEEAMEWRRDMLAVFPRALDPLRRDYRGKVAENLSEIVELDKRDIRASDCLLVRWTNDKPSTGTSMEIIYAWTLGYPVILWIDRHEQVLPWIRYHSTIVVHDRESAIAAVKRVGKRP